MNHPLQQRNSDKIIKIDPNNDIFNILNNNNNNKITEIENKRKNSAIKYCKLTKDLDHMELNEKNENIKNSNEKIKELTKEKEIIDNKIRIFKKKEIIEIKREKENYKILHNYFKQIATEDYLDNLLKHKNKNIILDKKIL